MHIKLKEILEKKEKSIYWLAKQCGVTYKTMFLLVNNKTNGIKFFIIERICDALNITPNDIFDLEND